MSRHVETAFLHSYRPNMADTKSFTLQDIRNMGTLPRLNMINAITGFKSACLIGTVSEGGVENLAVFNSVVHIGSNPPLIGFILRPVTVPRHTYQNILETGWYTINHIGESFYKKAHRTSGKYRKDISEFEHCGLTPQYTDTCKAPYVLESAIKIGLTFEEEHTVKANGTKLIVGAVRELMLPDEAIEEDGFIDLESAGTLAISGLDGYHKTTRLSREQYVNIPSSQSRPC